MLFLSLSLYILFSLFFFSYYTFSLTLLFTFFLFLTNLQVSNLYFYNLSLVTHDEVSLFIVYMTLFVALISFIVSYSSFSFSFSLFASSMLLTLFCILFFISSNSLTIYITYEASLLPIMFIILKWGSYPERSISSYILFIYTALFTFPFILVVIYLYSFSFSFSLYFPVLGSFFELSPFLSFLLFLTFSVKLPLYGVHFWLPMAHVEAPTFGSMILAGILLKLGGVGLLRFSYIVNKAFLSRSVLSYLLFCLIFTSIICSFQSDFKRLIAYSSVAHMIVVPILFLSDNLLISPVCVLVMFYHGLSSPLLFLVVGMLYQWFSTRQLVGIRGLLLVSPLFALILLLLLFFTVSAPPFPSFIAEAYFMLASYSLSSYFILGFLFFIFFSMVYNIN